MSINLLPCQSIIVQKGMTLKSLADQLGMSKAELIAQLETSQPDVLGKSGDKQFLKEGTAIRLDRNIGGNCRIATTVFDDAILTKLRATIEADVFLQEPPSLPKAVTDLWGQKVWVTVKRGEETIKFPGMITNTKTANHDYKATVSVLQGTKGLVIDDGSMWKSEEGKEREMLTDEFFTFKVDYRTGSKFDGCETVESAKIVEQEGPFELK